MSAWSAPVPDEAPGDDDGLTLIELIVGLLVSTIVVVGVATILVNSWLTQNDVLSTSQATNRGQLVSSAIEKAMRNALYAQVLGGGSELWVRTTFTDDRRCQAFHIADGVAEMKSDAVDVASAAWGRWLDVAEYDHFVVNVDAPPAGVFSPTGVATTVNYDFAVKTDSAPVQFSGEASIRAGQTGSGGCW